MKQTAIQFDSWKPPNYKLLIVNALKNGRQRPPNLMIARWLLNNCGRQPQYLLENISEEKFKELKEEEETRSNPQRLHECFYLELPDAYQASSSDSSFPENRIGEKLFRYNLHCISKIVVSLHRVLAKASDLMVERFGARHFICSFATRTATSESERAILSSRGLRLRRRLPIGW